MKHHASRSPLVLFALAWSLAALPAQEPEAPDPVAGPLAAAERAVEAADFATAARLFSEVIESPASDDEQMRARRGRAIAREQLEQLPGAVADLDVYLVGHADDGGALLVRGRIHSQLEQWGKALGDLDRAVALLPDDGDARAWRGATLVQAGQTSRGVTELEQAIALDGDSAWALYWLGRGYTEQGYFAKARDVLLKALRAEEDAPTLRALAAAECEMNECASALTHVDRAIELEPGQAYDHWLRGTILHSLRRHEEAEAALATAKEIDPEYRELQTPGEIAIGEALEPLLPLLGVLVVCVALFSIFSLIGMFGGRDLRVAMEQVDEGHTPARYDGRAGDLFVLYLKNVVLTLLTLGIYRFWANVDMLRFRYQHTSVGGGRFDYHGTGAEKLVGFLKGMAILAPFLGGLYLLYGQLEPDLGEESALNVCFFGFVGLIYLLRPLILVGSQRFNLGRTSFNHLRLRFTGTVGAAYAIYVRDLLLMACTLGIYAAWHQCNVRRFRLENTRLGEAAFGYKGSGGELFGMNLVGLLLTYLTLGLYTPWFVAKLHRYHIEHTTFRKHRLRSRLEGIHVVAFCAPALLLVVVTLGLALPLVLHRWYTLVTNTTSYPAVLDLDELQSIHDAGASATIEGVGEAGDALAGIGDLFGV